jgi:hypothetical protein
MIYKNIFDDKLMILFHLANLKTFLLQAKGCQLFPNRGGNKDQASQIGTISHQYNPNYIL